MEEACTAAYREVTHVMKFSHPNIIRARDVFHQNDELCSVYEYADSGSMADLIFSCR